MVQTITTDHSTVPNVKPGRVSVLLIEEDSRLRDSLADFLEDEGYEVDKCISANDAQGLLGSGVIPDLILLDEAALREADWVAELHALRGASLSRVPLLLLSSEGQSTRDTGADVDALLSKPVHPDTLLDALSRLLASAREERISARALEFQRLSSLGGLSTGLTNELNNPVSFVMGNLELARKKCQELSPRLDGPQLAQLQEIERLLHHAQRGATRVSEVVRSVASVPRSERGPVSAIDVDLGPGESEPMLAEESPVPRVSPDLRSEAAIRSSDPQTTSGARRARVLVVDDEQLMCELLATMLSDDYEVVALSSAREALARISGGETFDLVLCDLMMPDLTGMDLHAQLSREHPDQAARMVFMTGGTFTDRAQQFLAEHGRVQLQKPFRHDELLSLVQNRLEAIERSAQSNLH